LAQDVLIAWISDKRHDDGGVGLARNLLYPYSYGVTKGSYDVKSFAGASAEHRGEYDENVPDAGGGGGYIPDRLETALVLGGGPVEL